MKSDYKAKNTEDLLSDFIRIMTNDKGNAILAYTEFLVDILGWFLGNYTDGEMEKKEQERQKNLSQEEQKENAEKQKQLAEQQQKALLDAIKNAANEIKGAKTGSPEAEAAKDKALNNLNQLGDNVAKAKPNTLGKLAEIIAKDAALEHNKGVDPLADQKKGEPKQEKKNGPVPKPEQKEADAKKQEQKNADAKQQKAPDEEKIGPDGNADSEPEKPFEYVNKSVDYSKGVDVNENEILASSRNRSMTMPNQPKTEKEPPKIDDAVKKSTKNKLEEKPKLNDNTKIHEEEEKDKILEDNNLVDPKQRNELENDQKLVKNKAEKGEINEDQLKLAGKIVYTYSTLTKTPVSSAEEKEKLCQQCISTPFFRELTINRNPAVIKKLLEKKPEELAQKCGKVYEDLKKRNALDPNKTLAEKMAEKRAMGDRIFKKSPEDPAIGV